MSVLIKSMKIPQTCWYCKFEFYDKDWKMHLCDLNDEIRIKEPDCFTRRHPNCPLVDVPTPHGRLIDVDNLEFVALPNVASNDFVDGAIFALEKMDEEKIIIEAESGE